MITCAIHQPNFFPWLGYFDKIEKADVFVFLDRVNYPKSGKSMGSWCNRVKVRVGGSAEWISCPVVRETGVQLIDSVRIDQSRPWKDSMRRILTENYPGAPNFQAGFALIDRLLSFETDLLAEFNINAVTALSGVLGHRTKFVRQSELAGIEETSTARLIALTKALGAGAYLCGGGASEYQDDAAFGEAGVSLVYEGFQPQPYSDPDTFIPVFRDCQ